MSLTKRKEKVMTEYDDEAKGLMKNAVEDLQAWMANAGSDTKESDVLSWQQGYIAGVNRAMGVKNG
jgi:hypothetical protein